MTDDLLFRAFTPSDAPAMQALVLAGLEDHWGTLDPAFNHDLHDIAESYREAAIIVAERNGELVGCGILSPVDHSTGRLERMSVRRDQRGQGLGKKLVRALLAEAVVLGYSTVICETTETWTDAIALYRACGFHELGNWDGDTHFSISVAAHHAPPER